MLSISKKATITFVHGPQGSGKTAMLDTILKQSERWFKHSNLFNISRLKSLLQEEAHHRLSGIPEYRF